MSTANHPQPRHLKEPSVSRHKSKPNFDVPVETAPPEASIGWVYRAEEIAQPAHQSESHGTDASPRNPFMMVGEGLFLIGLGTVKLVYRAATGLAALPMRLAGMLISD